jgi:hypothetical protein
MFLKQEANINGDGEDSPTVGPLRIFKPQSPDPQDTHPALRFPAPPSTSSSASNTKPSFPLPPGASSSAAPLQFPDDDDDIRKPTPPQQFGSSYNHPTGLRLESPVDKKPGLAERRGAAPKPISSPTSPEADQGLFAKPLQHQYQAPPQHQPQPQPQPQYPAPFQGQTTAYYPPPGGSSADGGLRPVGANDPGVTRFASTASVSTTRASRGSPPPPETPIVEPGGIPGGGIEARYAASGISGTATLTSLQASQAQSAAASQRLAQYGNVQPQPQRPWTPTESPDQAPSGPPTVYQGSNPVSSPQPQQTFSPPPQAAAQGQENSGLQVSVLEQDFQRLGTKTPPPAYSSVTPAGNPNYPNEKGRQRQQSASSAAAQPAAAGGASPAKKVAATATATAAAGLASPALQHPGHPAFANDPRPEQNGQPLQPATPGPSMQPAQTTSPPPLPEGWIAHLDQNSGQYYYIHLATQATQWEFPKGPNPITHEQAPLSPTASTYGNPLVSPMFGKQSMASPMFPPHTPGYAESIMSVAQSQAPSTVGFTGPPPSAGVDMYRIQPTNNVYFGPYLRYGNMNLERGTWHGSILIVTDSPQPPTIHLHLSHDLSPNPKQLQPNNIYTHQRWSFHRYEIEIQMSEAGTERWTYAVTSHLGCTRYEFVVAGRHETTWRFIAHSGNDFSSTTTQNERAKLGGVGFMWKDVLQKNMDCGGFHVQLGLGDQIYADRLWKEVPILRQWLAMSGRDNRKNVQWTARHEEDVAHAYFHYYTSHFDQPFLREAFAQIPHVLQIDDHDM